MAPAEKTERVVNTDRSATHHEGTNSGSARGFSSPLLSQDTDRAQARPARTGFASASGWVVSL